MSTLGFQPAAERYYADGFWRTGDLWSEFEARATAGSAYVLFTKSPGGVIATAARVAAFRPMIDAAANGTGVAPACASCRV